MLQSAVAQEAPTLAPFSQTQFIELKVTAGAHVPLTQRPLAHCLLRWHLAPSGLGLAQARPGMEASVPPRRAAPISLSALPRDSVPLASPLASSSKVRLAVSWLTCCPLSPAGGLIRPAVLYNASKYEGLQSLAQLPRILYIGSSTSQNSYSTHFGE
jgi:hypothetical protein